MFYIVSITPILLGFDTEMIANSTIILLRTAIALLCFYTMRLPKVIPEIWSRSKRHVSRETLTFICILTGFLSLLQVAALAIDTSKPALIGNGIMLVLSVLAAALTQKNVELTISYEEC